MPQVNAQKREYTQDELDLIFDTFYDSEQRKLLPELLNRTMKAIELQFYGKVLKQRNMTVSEYYLSKGLNPPKKGAKRSRSASESSEKDIPKPAHIDEEITQEKEKLHSELVQTFKTLQTYPQEVAILKERFKQLENDFFALREEVDYTLKEFTNGVNNISSLMLERETRLPQYRQALVTIQQLEEKLAIQEEAHKEYVQKAQEQYFKVKTLLETLMNAPSFEKILKLEEFLPKIKYEINQWGQIVNPRYS